ncbi:MAG: hypothetical protein K8S13_05170 [Desulfobacula sp.]|uniref:hypothetical protein n=1 Tax=Desulfobacula sp. TaxID=2593537 RepID=UPI0025BC0AA7|nr:hypothetical protein [Desulfobacula sp.]MCD4719238.1 hypothetical protein [Desulfobacula sp.]
MEQKFNASVQYNDLLGSVAADKADRTGPSKWLADKRLINDDEFIVGISMSIGENHGSHQDPVYVTFLVSDLKGHNNVPEMLESIDGPMKVKKIEVDMNVTDFFALFKRFEVTMSTKGMIEGKMYETE